MDVLVVLGFSREFCVEDIRVEFMNIVIERFFFSGFEIRRLDFLVY